MKNILFVKISTKRCLSISLRHQITDRRKNLEEGVESIWIRIKYTDSWKWILRTITNKTIDLYFNILERIGSQVLVLSI